MTMLWRNIGMLCVIANATYETYVMVINNNTLSYISGQAKRKNMCVSCHISKKIREGRSLLIFFFF